MAIKNKKVNKKNQENLKNKLNRLIFIDFDGTLVDSLKAHTLAFNLAFLKNNLPPIPSQKFLSLFGYPSEEIIKYIFPKISRKKLKKINRDKYKFFIKETYKLVKLFPKVNQVLKKLTKNNWLILETNARLNEIKKVAKFCKLNLSYFDLILSKEKVKHRKPNVELIRKAIYLLRKNKKIKSKILKIWVVGDSFIDILLAKRAGAKVIIIINKINKGNLKEILKYKQILKYKPDFIIDSFDKILRII